MVNEFIYSKQTQSNTNIEGFERDAHSLTKSDPAYYGSGILYETSGFVTIYSTCRKISQVDNVWCRCNAMAVVWRNIQTY